MNSPHLRHTASVLPNGKVLAAGGFDLMSSTGFTNVAELYDPSTGKWTVTGSMNNARYFHTSSVLSNGKVLIVGGYNYNYTTFNGAELYDPSTGTWTLTSNMNYPRYLHSASVLSNGKVLVAGGILSVTNWTDTELYDPSTGTWTITGCTQKPFYPMGKF